MRRLLGALLVSSVVLVACDDGGPDEEAVTTTEQATTTSSSSTSTSTTEPVDFETEVRRAAIELLEVRNEVFMDPDVDRVSEYLSETCTCLERERSIVEGLVRDGVHWLEGPMRFQAIRVQDADEIEPRLTLISAQPQTDIVNAAGESVQAVPAGEDFAYSITLIFLDGAWRLNFLEPIDLNSDVIADVLTEGLP